jgi:hypothetical protein
MPELETPKPLEVQQVMYTSPPEPATQYAEPHETAEPEALDAPEPELIKEQPTMPKEPSLEQLEQQTLEQTEQLAQQLPVDEFEKLQNELGSTKLELQNAKSIIMHSDKALIEKNEKIQNLETELQSFKAMLETKATITQMADKPSKFTPDVDPRAQTAFAADLELQAIASIMTALSPLDYATSDRVMQYVYDRMCVHAE